MDLKAALKEKKAGIVKKWFEAVLETYQAEARGPLRRQDAQFTNPVGYNLAQGLDGLFEGLLEGVMPSEVVTNLETTVRIRAVQDFAPSQAVAFVFQLKQIAREELGEDFLREGPNAEAFRQLESAIDELALYAFDLYMRCREKIYDIKAKEARDMTFRLLQKAQVITGSQE